MMPENRSVHDDMAAENHKKKEEEKPQLCIRVTTVRCHVLTIEEERSPNESSLPEDKDNTARRVHDHKRCTGSLNNVRRKCDHPVDDDHGEERRKEGKKSYGTNECHKFWPYDAMWTTKSKTKEDPTRRQGQTTRKVHGGKGVPFFTQLLRLAVISPMRAEWEEEKPLPRNEEKRHKRQETRRKNTTKVGDERILVSLQWKFSETEVSDITKKNGAKNEKEKSQRKKLVITVPSMMHSWWGRRYHSKGGLFRSISTSTPLFSL